MSRARAKVPFLAAAGAVLALGGLNAGPAAGDGSGSTLTRYEAPVVLQQNSPADNGRATSPAPGVAPAFNVELPDALLGTAPSKLVAFRWNGGWEQIPVQVDEKEAMSLNRIYGGAFPSCPDPCYAPPSSADSEARTRHLNYTDPNTWVGPDSDPALDRDDEVALMARDAGGRAGSDLAPVGVDPASAVEVKITDPLYGGEGYAYLFESTGGLDPSAGKSYVDYDFNLTNGPYKTGAYSRNFSTPAQESGKSIRYGVRPETSEVRTPNYVRRFQDRWVDNDLEVHRAGATGVDILDRHDAQFDALDASCVRTQATYRAGEGAFVVNKSGPVRALRDFVGANSGPHVQRQHVFYDAKEVINTYLRVHAVPGVIDFFDYSAAGRGLEHTSGIEGVGAINSSLVIDGVQDPFVPFVGTSGTDGFEAVDGPQGGLTMAQRFVTNNADPSYHGVYRDLGNAKTCNGDGQLLGASGPQGNSAFENTDEAASASAKHLFYQRAMYYEAPGQADGPKRLAEEQEELQMTAAPIALRAAPSNQAPAASFTVDPAAPRPGKVTTFTSTSTDSDGTIANHAWDLDGDGAFDDATGPRATRTYDAGVYTVGLRVTDDDGASSQTTRSVRVCPERGGPKACKQ